MTGTAARLEPAYAAIGDLTRYLVPGARFIQARTAELRMFV